MTTSTKFNELNSAETPARELLERLGYEYVPRDVLAAEREGEREVLLKGRLTASLLRLNEWMTEDQAQRVIFNLEHVDATGLARNQAIHAYLAYGMPLTIDRGDRQETPTVRFFDFDHPEPGAGLNEYVVTTQFRVRRGNERGNAASEDDEKVIKPDLVLFVNGIPLVVMEAKSPTLLEVWKTRAVKQLRRYQEAGPAWHGAGAPELFDTNLLCVAHCGADAAFGALGAPENAYAGWKSLEPLTEAEFERRHEEAPEGQARLIGGLLNPPVLLDILRDFVVFQPERGRLVKKLPRFQQYRAVTNGVERILGGRTPEERGGVVWHTQGSGKSLTMLWLATKLRRSPALRNPTIVVVTDRTQLDRQITSTFRAAFVAGEPERAESTRELRELLRTSSGRTVMTTIQKFEEVLGAPAGDLTHLTDADNVVVMIDEAHRTQYGLLASKMRAALPDATFLGFTGTPIDKGFRRTTLGVFGGLIDSYTIPQSVADGATVAIHYEARLPHLHIEGPETLDRLFDALFSAEPEETRAEIRRRYANKERVAEAEKRIQAIAFDIYEHFTKKIQPNGFKAQVVAPSRRAALRYHKHLRDFGLAAYPVITTSSNDGPEFQVARDLDEDTIVEAFIDPAGEPQMLVVVDKLITGFDAPVEQVLYLDRAMRDHALLQAIARVNRRFSRTQGGVTTEKTYGLVIDYHGVSRELESALAIFDHGDVAEAMQELPEDPGPVIQAAAALAESHFRGLDLDDPWVCVHHFDADEESEGDYKADAYEYFDRDYREFSELMDRFLPDPAASAYLDRLRRLTVIRSYARAVFLRERADIDWTAVGAKVKELLDSRIGAEVRALMAPVSILDADFEQKIEQLPHDEARASVMEHALRAQIKENVEKNPAFYERLSEALERIIRELRARLIDAAEGSRQMAALWSEIHREEAIAAEHGLTPVSFAVYGLLAAGDSNGAGGGAVDGVSEVSAGFPTEFDDALKEAARDIDAILDRHRSIIDWWENLDVQREMRRDVKRLLRRTGRYGEDQLDELVRQVVEVARRRLA